MTSQKIAACDGCRLRKVRCHGGQPCTQCAHLNLRCHISPPAARRRRRHGHGELVAQLRTDRRASSNSPAGRPAAQVDSTLAANRSTGFFNGLIPQFSDFVYPLYPFIPPEGIQEAIASMETSTEDAALVYAFAAMTINRTRSSWIVCGELATLTAGLIHDSLSAYRAFELESDRLRAGILDPLPVTVKRVLTSIFLSVCMLSLGRIDRSFAVLREGITMLQTLNLRQHRLGDREQDPIWQRLYWEAYMHERHMAIAASFCGDPLPPLETGPPSADTSIEPHIDLGFRRLVNVFSILDDQFVDHLRAQRYRASPPSELTAEWIQEKQSQLDQDAADTALEEAQLQATGARGLSELQHVDLAVTRLWLRTLVWQLALSRGLLCYEPAFMGLSLHFPVLGICKELLELFNQLESVTSVGYHGIGMLEKLFDITSTIADVLLLLPGRPGGSKQEEHHSRRKDLAFILSFFLGFAGITKAQRSYLEEKLRALQELST